MNHAITGDSGMIERLTEPTAGCFRYDFKELSRKHVPGEFGTYEAFWAYSMLCKKLGEYEDLEEQGRLVRSIKCGECRHYVDCEGGLCTHSKLQGDETPSTQKDRSCSYGEEALEANYCI